MADIFDGSGDPDGDLPSSVGSANSNGSGSGEDLDVKAPASPLGKGSRRKRTTSTSDKSDRVYRTVKRTIFTAGRPPWYNVHGELKEAFVIGLCGGSASGKTTVAKRIIEELNVQWVNILSMDSFYKNFTEKERALAVKNEFNFDHPDAFDIDLIVTTLKQLKELKHVEVSFLTLFLYA
ncbi:uridine-cytidine kinase-like 1 [Saccoglossus kowalevskii]|uniref:Uridine-cytidine kinase-like 1-like n=1 Tax=Saccoglossus kowalevskii TaxID=10224 RepID=A0ABM0LUD1_SACKO|nr:PREDICTED: uridine-cytidine kinase-like 1-like [Saccoglossus kowalevskii]